MASGSEGFSTPAPQTAKGYSCHYTRRQLKALTSKINCQTLGRVLQHSLGGSDRKIQQGVFPNLVLQLLAGTGWLEEKVPLFWYWLSLRVKLKKLKKKMFCKFLALTLNLISHWWQSSFSCEVQLQWIMQKFITDQSSTYCFAQPLIIHWSPIKTKAQICNYWIKSCAIGMGQRFQTLSSCPCVSKHTDMHKAYLSL